MTITLATGERGLLRPADKIESAIANLELAGKMGQIEAPARGTSFEGIAWRFDDGSISFLKDCSKEQILGVVLPQIINQLRVLQEQIRGEQALALLSV